MKEKHIPPTQTSVPVSAIDVPTETIKLPSKGIVYPADSPLHTEEIEIRHLTARSEDVLTSRNLVKKGTLIDRLIQSALVDPEIKVEDMLMGDKNTIMVAHRITGYGAQYKTEVECSDCERKTEHIFDLSKMAVLGLGAEPVAEGMNKFEFTLPMSGKKVFFKLLTGRDDKQITEIVEASKKISDVEKNVTAKLFVHLLEVDGDADRQVIRKFSDTMKAGDSLALREYINEIEPGIEMIEDFECPDCGFKEEVDCPIGLEFFWPGWRRKRRRTR